MSLSRIALFALLATASTSAIAGSYQPIDNGVVVTPDAGAAKRVRVIAYGDDSFRVTAVPTGDFNEVPESLMVNAKPAGKPVVTQSKGSVTLKLPGASAVINLASGQVSFLDRAGKAVLTKWGVVRFARVTWKASAGSPCPSSSIPAPTRAFMAWASTRTAR